VPAYTNDLVRGARVRSSWATFVPSSATSGCRQLHRQRAPPLEWDVAADEYADFTKEYAFTSKEYRYQRLSTRNSYFQAFMNSGTHATNVGRSGRLSGGPETYLPMIVGWCWKCMVA
jgi:hypothetical protein